MLIIAIIVLGTLTIGLKLLFDHIEKNDPALSYKCERCGHLGYNHWTITNGSLYEESWDKGCHGVGLNPCYCLGYIPNKGFPPPDPSTRICE